MTKVKMSKGEEAGPEAFIDRRKAALEKYEHFLISILQLNGTLFSFFPSLT